MTAGQGPPNLPDPPDAPDLPGKRLIDAEAGPLVRPYVMTGGRFAPRSQLDLITQVITASEAADAPRLGLSPEAQDILGIAGQPISVAEIAAQLDLPPATVRVLLSDLLDEGLILTRDPRPATALHDPHLFKELLDGLRKL